jgi:hypothetical protein
MAMPASGRAPERVIDLELEAFADARLGFDPRVVLEQAVYAELSALARTSPERRANRGLSALDPVRRPS